MQRPCRRANDGVAETNEVLSSIVRTLIGMIRPGKKWNAELLDNDLDFDL